MSNHSNQLIEQKSYVKSNEMISAKYKSTLLENKVMAIALTRIEENNTDFSEPLEARLYPGELLKLVSDKAHIYRDLKALAKSITGHTMFLEDGKGNFKAFSVVPNADYQDGVFIIKFNQELKNHLLGLDKNFTTLELSMMTNFKKNSSFRIYELLKKDLFRSRASVNDGRVDVEYDLFEFRFLIGIANADNTHVQSRIKTMPTIDWEELYHVLEKNASKTDIKYKTTDKLKKDCLNPAMEELEKKSDLRFEYELIRVGRPYKKIVFHIYPNTPDNQDEIRERQQYIELISKQNRQLIIPMDTNPETKKLYEDFVGHNELAKEDLDHLLRVAEMNSDDIRKAIAYADDQGEINNYMGYLVKCIQNRYFDNGPIEVLSGSHRKAVIYNTIIEESHSDDTKTAVWNRIKIKDDFPRFIAFIEDKGLGLDDIEQIYSIDETVQMYLDWKKGAKVVF